MKGRDLIAAAVGGLVVAALAGGVAWATIPGSDGVIQGCYDSGGNVKVVPSLPCPRGYTPFQWNQQGPKGDPGAPGPKGDKGEKGDPCLSGDPACIGPKGDKGEKGDKGDTGAPGASGGSPVGTVVPYAGSTAPPGWLVADGSAVSRSTYSELFAAIGTTYGAGDGSTTFNLPDLRGRVVVSVGSNGDVSALGESDGAVEPQRSPSHTHIIPAHSHGIGTLAVGFGGGHTHTVAGSFTSVMRCGTTSGCDTGAEFNGTVNTLGGFGGSEGVGGSAQHTHGLSGRVGDTGGADGDQAMTSGKSGPSYIALIYVIRAG
jgi:microcystin-dependent protein